MTSLTKEKITEFISDFSMRALSSIISKTVASPLEVIKLQMQNQDELIKQNIISKTLFFNIKLFN